MSGCGHCTLCCKVLGIEELQKPAGTWCSHCERGRGCTIYNSKPPSCNVFECIWLMTHTDEKQFPNGGMPHHLRPDKCHVVLTATTNGKLIVAQSDPAFPNAWKYGKIGDYLRRVSHRLHVIVKVSETEWKAMHQGKLTDIEMTPKDEFGVQYFLNYQVDGEQLQVKNLAPTALQTLP